MKLQARETLRANARLAVDRYYQVIAQSSTRALLVGLMATVVGGWLNLVALMALAYNFGDGALGVGGMLAVRMIPGLLLQGPAGLLVDRVPGRTLMLATQLAMAATALAFLLLSSIQNLVLLYGLVFVLESLNTIVRPAFLVQIVGSVKAEHRGAVNGLIGMGMTVAQFVGALLGALVLGVLSPNPVFVINALLFLAVALRLSRLSLIATDSPQPGGSLDAPVPPGAVPGGMAGYRSLLRRTDVFLYAALSLAASVMIQAATALFEVRARRLDLDEGGNGIFFGAVAIGLLIGGAAAGAGSYTRPATLRLMAVAEMLSAVGLIAFGMADHVWLAALALVMTGIMAELSEVPALTYFQHRLPLAIYGRFFSVVLIASAAGGLTGALLGPALQREIGSGRTMQIISIPVFVLAFLVLIFTRLQPQDDPAAASLAVSHATLLGRQPELPTPADD